MKGRAERLDEESIRYVYKTYMKIDFPRSELKPLKSILSLIQQKRGEGYGFYDKDELTGYAFLIKAPSGRAYLIDYLAVLPSLRDRGYGSACLSALQNILEEKNTLHSKILGTGENMESTANEREYMIMVESEDPSFAADETEKQVRRRRIRFYEKNGFFDSQNVCRLFGVEYRILGKTSCMTQEEPRNMRCKEELDSIYRTIIPKLVYHSQVKWM